MTTTFDEIMAMSNQLDGVRKLKGRHENLELDCKTKAGQNNGSLDKGDRIQLGKAMSAFANSMGGTIVWGLTTTKADGADVIDGFAPIKELSKFVGELQTAVSEVVRPHLDGIRILMVQEDSIEDSGYVLVDVPRSERRPHKSEVGDKAYYRRSGSTSRVMEHFEIEDAFKRTSVPELSLSLGARMGMRFMGPSDHHTMRVGIIFRLRNESAFSARFPYISFERGGRWVEVTPYRGIVMNTDDKRYTLEGGADVVINPEVQREMGFADTNFIIKLVGNDRWEIAEGFIGDLNITVKYGCYDSKQKTETIKLPVELILKLGGGGTIVSSS